MASPIDEVIHTHVEHQRINDIDQVETGDDSQQERRTNEKKLM